MLCFFSTFWVLFWVLFFSNFVFFNFKTYLRVPAATWCSEHRPSLLMLWRIGELVLLLGAPLWLSYCYGTKSTKLNSNNPTKTQQQSFRKFWRQFHTRKITCPGYKFFSPASLHPFLCFQYVWCVKTYGICLYSFYVICMFQTVQCRKWLQHDFDVKPISASHELLSNFPLSNIECWVSPAATFTMQQTLANQFQNLQFSPKIEMLPNICERQPFLHFETLSK